MDLSNNNVIHVKKGKVEYLQFKRLLEYKGILNHAYSLGKDVNFRTAKVDKTPLPKEEYERAIRDYKNLCDSIGSNYINIVKTNQNHTNNVKIVDKELKIDAPDINLEEYDQIDGLVTNKKNLILSTTNADCILLLFFDPIKKVIANVHSGWKGTLQRISVVTIEKMINEFGSKPEDIICCILPSIRKCHFEVDEDVKDMFINEFKDLNELDKIIKEKQNKWYIDTVLINKIILKKAGMLNSNIIDSEICSVCNKNLVHSFRVEKEGYGLATALIALKGD